ncbi:hypothetical protein KIH39_00130 [Telmatocola sphagniphila]|uniref:Uncharacterized protein n=1 Tax=Telmatocola sphagniphila TaxID=1123043 RepID=A0A8E6EVB0_9BACT|nr:hypothetical protein [Telmatocola sphagniphila]QVL32362.1 hypothetical protein KIH39_00130 [Telmatocola sphagniphila]
MGSQGCNLVGGPFDGHTKPHHVGVESIYFLMGSNNQIYDEDGPIVGVAEYSFDLAQSLYNYRFTESDNDKERELLIELGYYNVLMSPCGVFNNTTQNDSHPQVEVRFNNFVVCVDEKMANLIWNVWRRNWRTVASCQESPASYNHDGMAYVEFLRPSEGRQFATALLRANIGCSTLTNAFGVFGRPDRMNKQFYLSTLKVLFSPTDIETVTRLFT